MKLSFGQWVKLGFGGLRIAKAYRDNVPVQTFAAQASELMASVFPAAPAAADAVSHAEVIDKIRTGLSPDEQAQFDRASQGTGT